MTQNLTLLLLFAIAVPARAQEAPLVFEHGERERQLRYADGVLQLTAGPGWTRTRTLHSDFILTLEFRLFDTETRANIGLRAVVADDGWPMRGQQIALTTTAGSGAVVARRQPPRLDSSPAAAPRAGEWIPLVVTAIGREVIVSLGGETTGKFTLTDYSGSVVFEVARGVAEFRNIKVRDLPLPPAVVKPEPLQPGKISPRLTHEVKPSYTKGAMERGVEGVVSYEAVVGVDGRVGAVRLATLLDPELEHMGLAALRQWRFKPGTLNGTPVSTLVEIEITFTLK